MGKRATAGGVRDRLIEVEGGAPTRKEGAGIARVSVDPPDEGRSDIGHSPARNSRLAVDDPVALKLSRNRQVIARKVIPLGDRVIVPRIAADLEKIGRAHV